MVCCIQQRHRVGYIGFSERSALTPGTFVLILLFSSFTFLSFTLPALQRARKAMTQPARVTAFSFCYRKMLPAQSVVACLKFCAFCKRHCRRICSLLRAKREPERTAVPAGHESPSGAFKPQTGLRSKCRVFSAARARRFRRAGPDGLRHPASASCLGRHSHPAGRCPNSSSLFRPLAAVVAVAN